MSYAKENLFELTDFPGYKCYSLEFGGNYHPTQANFDKGVTEICWMWSLTHRNCTEKAVMLPKRRMQPMPGSCTSVKPEDRLLFHPNSKIPRKLVSRGIVVNDKSTDAPDKFVIPRDYLMTINNRYYRYSQGVIMVNEYLKVVFYINSYVDRGEKLGGTLQQWRDSLGRNKQLKNEFGNELYAFDMPYGLNEYTVYFGISELDATILAGMLPEEVVVDEQFIETGTEPVTTDMLYSVYMMLKSPDIEIVETAFNMLAHSKFAGSRSLIKWLLQPYDGTAVPYKSKSTAFAWLYKSCDCSSHRTVPHIYGYDNIKMAKELIARITKNEITWNDDGSLCAKDTEWINDYHIRELVNAVK